MSDDGPDHGEQGRPARRGDAGEPVTGEVEMVVPEGVASTWEARHARGEVPGRWPYGLEWLADARDLTVRLRGVGDPSRARRVMTRVLPDHVGDAITGLAWDENLAHRMLTSRRYGQMHCGVIWANDRWEHLERRTREGLRRTLGRMASVWTLSQGQLDRFELILPASTPRHFVRFGIDETFFTLAQYPDRPMVFSAGGDRDRDHATLLEAFSIVVAARPRVQAVLQTRERVRAPQGVQVVPHLSHLELREMYRRASVVAVATRPNLHVSGMTVSLEAQATGRPVVLTDTAGTSDYVADGTTGFLVRGGSSSQLADRLIGLLDDAELAQRLGRQGRSAVEGMFTSRHLAERLLEATGLQ